MYTVDEQDRVVELKDVPQSSVGAPNPVVIADEGTVVLAYYRRASDPNWNGVPRIVGKSTQDPIVLVRFYIATAHMFGPPNDEAFDGHPLASRGLEPYGVFEVQNSSWIRRLEHMNSVHPHHSRGRYSQLKHFIFSFHDSVFECVADRCEFFEHEGSIERAVPKMIELLDWSRV